MKFNSLIQSLGQISKLTNTFIHVIDVLLCIHIASSYLVHRWHLKFVNLTRFKKISITYLSILEVFVSSLLIFQNHRKYKKHQELVEFGLFLKLIKMFVL